MSKVSRVGIIVQPTRMYFRRVVGGIAAFGLAAGWEWLMVPAEGMSAIIGPTERYLDGLIGHFSEPRLVDRVVESGLPAIDISDISVNPHIVRVSSDDVAVGRLAAAHLLSLGLTHFGFFGASSQCDSQSRCDGFQRALEAARLRCDKFLWSMPGHEADSPIEPNGELEMWILRLPKPVGILASNDRRALQLLAVCTKHGIPVPKSVAVLGVDNDEVFCELANPPLSSIALATQRIGYEAARELNGQMSGKKPKEMQMLIPPAGVVSRRSSDIPPIFDAEIAAAVRYISLHVQDDLHIADILNEVPLSRRSLHERFRRILGRTPAQEIRRAQVELAKQMLAETDEPMSSVAMNAGFSNAKQLGSTFHHEMGMTPTIYRRQHRRPNREV